MKEDVTPDKKGLPGKSPSYQVRGQILHVLCFKRFTITTAKKIKETIILKGAKRNQSEVRFL